MLKKKKKKRKKNECHETRLKRRWTKTDKCNESKTGHWGDKAEQGSRKEGSRDWRAREGDALRVGLEGWNVSVL